MVRHVQEGASHRAAGFFYIGAAIVLLAATAPIVLGQESSEEMSFLPGTVAFWRPVFMGGAGLALIYGVFLAIKGGRG